MSTAVLRGVGGGGGMSVTRRMWNNIHNLIVHYHEHQLEEERTCPKMSIINVSSLCMTQYRN